MIAFRQRRASLQPAKSKLAVADVAGAGRLCTGLTRLACRERPVIVFASPSAWDSAQQGSDKSPSLFH